MEPCPLGTFGSLEGLFPAYVACLHCSIWMNGTNIVGVWIGAASVVMCQSCTPGQYCAEPGLSSPSGPCSPGYYCIQGSHTPTPQYYNNTGHFLHLPQCLIMVVSLSIATVISWICFRWWRTWGLYSGGCPFSDSVNWGYLSYRALLPDWQCTTRTLPTR